MRMSVNASVVISRDNLITFLVVFLFWTAPISLAAQNAKWEQWEAQGDTLLSHDDFKGAIKLYTKIVKASKLQDKAGMVRESIRSFENLLKARPEDASLLNALGYSLADRNQKLPRAEQLIRKALESSPDNPAFLDSLGWVRFRRGDVAGAIPHLERAYRIFPDAEIASHWGEALWVSGKQSEARSLWARSLARSPDSKALRATIERLTGTKMEAPQTTPAPDEKKSDDAAEPDALPTTPTASVLSGR